MYRLYGSLGAASMTPQAVLEEAGAPYEFVAVDISSDKPRDPAYLRLNPHGRVPTLVDDGRAMYETSAICMFLADRHPKAGIAPAIDDPARGLYLQWMVYLSNTLQETYLTLFYSERYSTDPSDAPAVRAKAAEKLVTILANFDRALEPGPYLIGKRCSAADIYLFMLTVWHPSDLKPMSTYQNIVRCRELVAKRPAVQRMLKANQIAA